MKTINSAINEKILPSFQNTTENQKSGFRAEMDHWSSGRNRTTEVENTREISENYSRVDSNARDQSCYLRDSTVDSLVTMITTVPLQFFDVLQHPL